MLKKEDFTADSFLYRYRSASEYNFDALLHNVMYASTPNILNDPLDSPITYDLDKLYKRLIKRESFVGKYAEQIFPASYEKKDPSSFNSYKEYEDYYQSISVDSYKKTINSKNAVIVKAFINQLAIDVLYAVRECFGIVSFSLSCANSVMWSHYASNYSGFVLRYHLLSMNQIVNEVADSNYFLKQFNGICGLHKVNYVSVDQIIDGTDLMYELICKRMAKKYEYKDMMDFLITTKYQDLLLQLLTTKDRSWEYEQEVRLIYPREDMWMSLHNITGDKNKQFFKVSDHYSPNGIIVGANMSSVHKAVVGYYCLQNNHVLLQRINVDNLMSERLLYLTLVKPQELIDKKKEGK